MIVDVGQFQIKVTLADRRFLFPRDFDDLPIASEVSPEDVPHQRERLRAFLSSSLRRAEEESGLAAERIVVALPCELGDDGVPGDCSYAGMSGDRALVSSVLKEAQLNDIPGFLLNDAELAAISAGCLLQGRAHPEMARSARTLVLTLGFGVGAAMLLDDWLR